jgi:septal ring factor EnvC (AmiA/AmiB activator)
MINYLFKSFVVLLIISTGSVLVYAQELIPQIDTFNPETRKSYEDTQKLINETRTKLDLVRTQNNARTREIEALTNKIGAVIRKISGQGEDNTALQSEISVLDELLAIERKITGDLRIKNIQLVNKLNTIRIKNTSIKNQQTETAKINEAKLIKTKKRLEAVVAKMASRGKINKQLEINIKTLATEVVRLRKQIKLLKKNRYRSKLRAN